MPGSFFKLGIIGWPLGYSLSPLMHEAALEAAGLQGEYKEYPVRPGTLEEWLEKDLPAVGLDGFNVTMPHKEGVYAWIKSHGKIEGRFPELIHTLGAVNTVKVEGKSLVGFNTDGEGFLGGLDDLAAVRGKHVLLLGAGGTAQAIAVYLVWAGQIGSLRIWNRHLERAEQLVDKMKGLHSQCDVSVLQSVVGVNLQKINLVVNATPVGMSGSDQLLVDVSCLSPGVIVYDIVYYPRITPLIRAAQVRGMKVITGDRMLAEQGAAAFQIWTGTKGMLSVMQRALD